MNKLNYLFLFQNFISSGSFEIEVKNLVKIKVSCKDIEIDILNYKKLKNLVNLINKMKKKEKKESFLNKIKSFKSLLDFLNELAKKFRENNKRLILKYNGEPILIIGERGLLSKNFKIKNKSLLLKILLS
ncbi:hypothetical protein [Methanocaldococcus sp.]